MQQQSRSFLKKEIAKNNIMKISRLSKMNIVAAIIIFVLNVVSSQLLSLPFSINQYLPLFFLCLFHISCIAFVTFFKISYTVANFKKIESFVDIYVAISLIATAFVVGIYPENLTYMVFYSLLIFTIATFFIMRLKSLLIPSIISSCLIVCSFVLQSISEQSVTIYLSFLIALHVIGCYLLQTHTLFFIKNMSIKEDLIEEIQYRKEISKDLREANRKLLIQNMIDPLTGLQNRMSFNSHLDLLKNQTEQMNLNVAAIMIDIDCFKKYNDFYGHTKGDEVISKVGQAIFETSEKYGVFAARYGGEEFVLLMHNHPIVRVKTLCDELIHKVAVLNIPHENSDVDRVITISIGAKIIEASNPRHIIELIDYADSLLYEVKRGGKNTYIIN